MQNPEFLTGSRKVCVVAPNMIHQPVLGSFGGGAGLEPAYAAYVGEGMLTAAVSGIIFASPSVSQIADCKYDIDCQNRTRDFFHFSFGS